jgi:pSer/pThr/pTyr-binding forkhead associated (FHA) protein
MENRYSLRFETGERTGETIALPGGGFTIGRKPGNSLQILDSSVSGNHAVIEIDAEGARVRDQGSTNGTRVGEQRVIEARLAHGDQLTFGNVRLSFCDAQAGSLPTSRSEAKVGSRADADASSHGDAPSNMRGEASSSSRADGLSSSRTDAPSSSRSGTASGTATAVSLAKTTTSAPAEGLLRISADVLARSSKRSRLGIVIVLLLALGGGGLWFYLNHSSGSSRIVERPVKKVDGDLFADEYSFEGDHDSWSAAEGSPVAFLKSERARYSGSFGMGCEISGQDWALHRSQAVRCDADRELEARAMIRAGEQVEMRLGVEFSAASSGDAPSPGAFTAWARATRGTSGFQPASITVLVPPGYANARVCVLARPVEGAQGGNAAFDDVSLVQRASTGKPTAQVNENRLYVLGDPASTAMLFKVDRVLISSLEASKTEPRAESTPLELRVGADASKINVATSEPLPPGGVFSLRAEAPLARSRIATIASGAYATHAAEFDRDKVEILLLGNGNDLVDLKFAAPVHVVGVADGAASRITIRAAGQQAFDLQLDFKSEKKEAGNLAYAARNAEKQGELGQCLKQWEELLNRYPYEEALVAEAEGTRGRLIQKGLEDLRVLRGEIERARFFRLVDLYRQCRDKALAVGARYAPSEVETEAKNVAAEVDVDLASLETDLSKNERTRLTEIMNSLEAQKATGLASEVKAYLDGHYAEKK